MRSLRRRLGAALFWIFFVPYTVGVVMFLAFGLAPSVAKEFGSIHDGLHDYADDALRAGRDVTIQIENGDGDLAHFLVIRRTPRSPIVANGFVAARGATTLRFTAPPPGAYRITSPGDPAFDGELRFTNDGASRVTLRVDHAEHRVERVGATGWPGVAGKVADASHRADHGAQVTLEALFSALNLGLGLLLVSRRPHDRTARLLAVAMIGTAAFFNHQAHSTVRDYLLGDWWAAHDLFHLVSGITYLYAVVVFPDGKLVPSDSHPRWLLRVGYGVATFLVALVVLGGTSEGHPGQPFFTVLFGLLIPLAGVGAQTYRLRHATDPVVHQQSRLLRWALLPMFLVGVLYLPLTRVIGGTTIENIGLAVFPALFALVPLALVMGILRYRLWDIDILVSRTLLSVGLAAFIGLVYVVVVVVLGHGLGPGGSAGAKILATAIAAVAFEPVRERLARLANRLVYGERATPYEVMADFGDRLAGAISVDEILPRIAEAAVKGVGAVAGRVTALLPSGGTRAAAWPEDSDLTSFSFVMPVTYRGERVGEIAVATAHGERMRPADESLLAALAAQAGLAVNNARLTMELQARLQEISEQADELHASRQRIVTARQLERQRVVEIIHDRVEVRLQHASVVLDELEPLLPAMEDRALECVDALLDECGQALEALRGLARGIFPAILADQGVVPALEAYVLQAQLPIDVALEGTQSAERYNPQAEASVYFCMIQALANAGAYAPGSTVIARVYEQAGNIAFSVADDGPGADPRRLHAGADVRDMRDRVEAVGGAFEATTTPGGGTVISGWVPIDELVLT